MPDTIENEHQWSANTRVPQMLQWWRFLEKRIDERKKSFLDRWTLGLELLQFFHLQCAFLFFVS
jgi:hypothetical protein